MPLTVKFNLNAMNLPPDTLRHCDLTASLPHLKSSLTPHAPGYSGVSSSLYDRRRAATRQCAEELSKSACWMMAAFILFMVGLFSVAVFVSLRQPEMTPSELRELQAKGAGR